MLGLGLSLARNPSSTKGGLKRILAIKPCVYSGAAVSARPVQQGQVCNVDNINDEITLSHLTGAETIVSYDGTAVPVVSAGKITFSTGGWIANLILSDGSIYNLNHGSGIDVFDSSGNLNHGTLGNGASYGVNNNLPVISDKLNLEGYTDDGGVLKPRDESNPALDIDGNPLQYSGSVYPVPPVKRDSYCATTNGTNSIIRLGNPVVTHDAPWSVELSINYLAYGTYEAFYGEGSTGSLTRLFYIGRATSNYIHVGWTSNDGTQIVSNSVAPLPLNTWLRIKAEFDGVDNFKVFVNDVEELNVTISPKVTTLNTSTLGSLLRSSNGLYSNCRFSNIIKTKNGSIQSSHPLAEGLGDTAYDVSGNSNHGTIFNGSTATEGIGFWAGRQNEYHYNLDKGFSYDFDGEAEGEARIPALADDSGNAANGSGALTNPPVTGGHNNAETEWDAYNIAEGDNPCPASNAHADLDAIDFDEDLSSNDAAYMRLKSATLNDRLFVFPSDLIGTEKSLLENYTS